MPQAPRPKELLDQMRDILRTPHDAIRTEHAYVDWARRFILFHQKRHPTAMGWVALAALLTHLAVDRHRAASTHHQALSALLLLSKAVLRQDGGAVDAVRARKPTRLPTVLTTPAALRVLHARVGVPPVLATRLYGSGVRDGKGEKDQITLLPETLVAPFQEHLERVKQLHTTDRAEGYGAVYLPYALERQYPNANREWGWQYVFPATSRSVDPRTGTARRHHLDESRLQKAVRTAARLTGIDKHVPCHTLRHSCATQVLAAGDDIRTVQALLGHQDVKTTMISTHVLNRGAKAVRSPLD